MQEYFTFQLNVMNIQNSISEITDGIAIFEVIHFSTREISILDVADYHFISNSNIGQVGVSTKCNARSDPADPNVMFDCGIFEVDNKIIVDYLNMADQKQRMQDGGEYCYLSNDSFQIRKLRTFIVDDQKDFLNGRGNVIL